MTTTSFTGFRTAVWLCAAALGCTGTIEGPMGPSGTEPSEGPAAGSVRGVGPASAAGGGAAGTGAGAPAAGCGDPGRRGAAENGFRRLTREEIARTVEDLFGTAFYRAVKPLVDAIPPEKIHHGPEEFVPFLSSAHVDILLDLGVRMGELIAASSIKGSTVRGRPPIAGGATLMEIGGPCAAESPPGEPCLRALFTAIGLRVWRRPLLAAEVEALVALHRQAASPAQGMVTALARIFVSPHFLFLIERGAGPTPDGRRHRLTPHEVAARLSYRAAGTTPDGALLEAAAAGALDTLVRAETHARRLVESERGREKLHEFLAYWLDLPDALELSAAALARAGLSAEGLYAEMLAESRRFVEHVTFERMGSFADLLLSPAAFPRTAALAKVYDAPVWTGSGPPVAPRGERVGLLLRGPLLASDGERTDPINRGVFLRRRVLCDPLQSPDPNIIAARDEAARDLTADRYSTRQIVEAKTSPAVCMSCHAGINPLGFALEAYDTLGRFRQQETVYSGSKLVAAHPIDTRVADGRIDGAQAGPLSGARDLVAALAATGKTRACMAGHLFVRTRIRAAAEADRCALADLDAAGNLVDLLVANVANQDLFYRAGY